MKILSLFFIFFYSISIQAQTSEEQFLRFVENNRIESVDVFLSDIQELNPNFNINAFNSNELSALMLAAKNRSATMLSLILSYRDRFYIHVNQANTQSYSALIYATLSGCFECVRVLVRHGAELEQIGQYGVNAIFTTLTSNRSLAEKEAIADYLISNNIDLGKRDQHGYATVHYVAALGSENLMRLLLSLQTRINTKTTNGGYFPLYLAAHYGHFNMVKLLLHSNAYLSLQTTNGETPLHVAIRHNDLNIAKLLIEAGMSGTIENQDGEDALLLSAKYNTKEIYTQLYASDQTSRNQQRANKYLQTYHKLEALRSAITQKMLTTRVNNFILADAVFTNDARMLGISFELTSSDSCTKARGAIQFTAPLHMQPRLNQGFFEVLIKVANFNNAELNHLILRFNSEVEGRNFINLFQEYANLVGENDFFSFRFGEPEHTLTSVHNSCHE